MQNNGILLWATNFSYLNDTRELIEGINLTKRIESISIKLKAFRNYYVTSFSEKKMHLICKEFFMSPCYYVGIKKLIINSDVDNVFNVLFISVL